MNIRLTLACMSAMALCGYAHAVDVRAYVIAKTSGEVAADMSRVEACIDDMNFVYAQVGLRFDLRECSLVFSNELYVVVRTNTTSWTALCDYAQNTGGIELYFVGEIAGAHVNAFCTKGGIVIGPDATPRDVSHEIGHACGWKDIYEAHAGTDLAVSGRATEERLQEDWSPYYPRGITQAEIIHRLLMYGRTGDGHVAIPRGDVYGLWYVNVWNPGVRTWSRDWRLSAVPVSAWHGMNRNPASE